MHEVDRVAIIGAGNLGSRHLQAMALTKRPTEVVVIDPSKKSLEIARGRWGEMLPNPLIRNCKFYSGMEGLPSEIDVAIVATSSGPRRQVLEELISISKVKYLILEKFLFQNLEDFEAVGHLLKDRGILAYVNCGRREVEFYRKLHNALANEQRISMSVMGGDWGIGCNSIHMLDIYAFLTRQEEFKGDGLNLDDGAIDSKRKGYIEFTGELDVNSCKGRLSMISYVGERPMSIVIDSDNFHIDIDEKNQLARILRKDGGEWTWEMCDVKLPFQSSVTQKLVQDLIEKGECGLTTYDESTRLHRVLLEVFLEHLSKGKKERCFTCPVT